MGRIAKKVDGHWQVKGRLDGGLYTTEAATEGERVDEIVVPENAIKICNISKGKR